MNAHPKVLGIGLLLLLALPSCFKSKQPNTVTEAFEQLEASGQLPKLNHDDTLLGPDVDKNGVRDDIDAYIDTLPDTPAQKAALRQDSRTLNGVMKASTGSESELLSAVHALGGASLCESSRYDRSTFLARSRLIEKITINTKIRFDAYMAADDRMRGKTSMLPQGDGCED